MRKDERIIMSGRFLNHAWRVEQTKEVEQRNVKDKCGAEPDEEAAPYIALTR